MYKSTLQTATDPNEKLFPSFLKSSYNDLRSSKQNLKYPQMNSDKETPKMENPFKKSTSSSNLVYSPSHIQSHINSVVMLGDKTNQHNTSSALAGSSKDNCIACCKKKQEDDFRTSFDLSVLSSSQHNQNHSHIKNKLSVTSSQYSSRPQTICDKLTS